MKISELDPTILIPLLDDLKSILLRQEYILCFNQRLADGYNIIHTPRRKLTYGNTYSETLVSFFADNKGFNQQHLNQIISTQLLDALLTHGIVYQTTQNKILSAFRIIPIRNLFLLLVPFQGVSSPPVYLGADSYTFQRHIQIQKIPRKILDLATGSGYQLFSLPWQGNTSDMLGIDINPNAIFIAKLNAQWNKTPWISFHERDITQDLDQLSNSHAFDLILGNPPIIPTPENIGTRLKGMIHADGGVDGLKVIRTVLPQIPAILSKKGSAQFILSALGSSSKPSIIPELNQLLESNNLHGRLIAIKKIPVELDSYYRGQRDKKEYQRWMKFYQSQGADYWYRLILRITHRKANVLTNSVLDYIQLYRTEFAQPPNRERVRPIDIRRRIPFYLTDTVLQNVTKETFERALIQLKKIAQRPEAFTLSICEFGKLLGQELENIFPNDGAAIRFWAQASSEYWFKPKYQERVMW